MSNAEVIKTAIENLNAGDLEGWLAAFADDMTAWWPSLEKPLANKAEFRRYWESMFKAYPGCQLIENNVIATGEWVVCECRFSATHTGPLETPNGVIEPTGGPVGGPGIDVYRLRDGKVVTQRGYFDASRLKKQVNEAVW
jgi:predicted ester cyclase